MERGFNGEEFEKESMEASSLCVDVGSWSLPSVTKAKHANAYNARSKRAMVDNAVLFWNNLLVIVFNTQRVAIEYPKSSEFRMS